MKLSSENSGPNLNFAGSSHGDMGGNGVSVVEALKYLRSPPAEGRFTGFVSQQRTMISQISSVVTIDDLSGCSLARTFSITTGSLSPR